MAVMKDTSLSSVLLDIAVYTFLVLLLAATVIPILHIGAVSLSSGAAISQGRVFITPVEITAESYKAIFRAGTVARSFKNSVILVTLGTATNMLLTCTMAYPLTKKRMTFHGFYTGLVVFTMFFSGGLIPTFLVVRSLGLYDSIWALILPVGISVWNLIIMRTFFQSIPTEMEESVFLEGGNDLHAFFLIVLPLSKAAIATITLFYLVFHWNGWFTALIYLRTDTKYPLQLILRNIIIENMMSEELDAVESDDFLVVTEESIKYATLFISIIPMLLIYPFIQKHFVKGVMIGSLKG